MQQLIRTEWMKVRTYKAFWIMAGIFVIAVIGLNYISFSLNNSIHVQAGKTAGDALLGNPFAFPDVWNTVSWMSGWLLFIPGMLLITLIANEYTYRTHRQNIIDGWTRTQFISVKLLWVVTLSVLGAVVAFATALVFGYTEGSPFGGGISYIGYFFLESLSYLMAALLFPVCFRPEVCHRRDGQSGQYATDRRLFAAQRHRQTHSFSFFKGRRQTGHPASPSRIRAARRHVGLSRVLLLVDAV
jgi:ABC-2 type transport system permease protein